MKKVLMGTTALVAAGMMAGAAQAQEEMMEEPISLSLGGYYRAAIGSVSGNDGPGQPEADRHTIGIAQDAEVRIAGETTLDNGLTVGVNAHMEVVDGGSTGGIGGGSGDAAGGVDEAWLYFKDEFGQLRLGSVESARQDMTNFAPGGAGNFGVNSPFFTFASNSWLATYEDGIGNEDAAKLVYYSPSFNGFRLGLSWAPDDNDGGQQYGTNKSDSDDDDDGMPARPTHTGPSANVKFANQVAIGMEFSQSFMEGSNVRIAGGYETYEAEYPAAAPCVDSPAINCEPSSLHLGATIGFDQISFGGGWMKIEQADNQDKTIYDLGLSWSDGPMVAGLQWGHASTGNAATPNGPQPDTELNRYAVNGTYVLGPGIDLQAQLDFGENDAPGQNAPGDNDWTQFMLGTAITF